MKTVILAGGLGTRLSEETVLRPKPMVEIGGKPILWHILNIYAAYDFREFIIALGYKGEQIKEYFLNFYALNNDLTIDLARGSTKVHDGDQTNWIVHLVDTGQADVTWLEPDRCGHVQVEDLTRALADTGDAALVTVMWANNEVGTVQPIQGLAEVARSHGVPLHTDAVQAVGHLRLSFADSGADLMTVSAHKFGGPIGVGALLARRGAALVPLSHGGGQERQVRSGTLDAPAVHAFAVALDEAVRVRDVEAKRLGTLRDRLIDGAMALGLGITVSGCWSPGDVEDRLPGNAHLLVPDAEGDSLLYLLDAAGVEVSTGSACQAGVPRPSHVLLAMGYTDREARGALRISLGHSSTDADVDAFLAALPGVVERARRASRRP